MHEGLIVLDGSTFFLSEWNGDVEPRHAHGYFHTDVRHLSRWRLRLAGEELQLLASRAVDYFSARIVVATEEPDPSVSVRRDRFVTEGVHEDVVVTNHGEKPRRLRLELEYGSDFADVLEAREAGTLDADVDVEVGDRTVTLSYVHDGFRRGTRVVFSAPCDLDERRAVFDLELAPGGQWKTCVDIVAVVDGRDRPALLRCDAFGQPEPEMPMTLAEWNEEAPELSCDWEPLVRTYRRSLEDLASLRLRPGEDLEWALPAGGMPWFMTLFGRDSLIASYQALPFHSSLAHGTLKALAALQATEDDPFRDAEPGKILHELRRGKLVALGEAPHPYYGTHDATLLFLILLDEYERWSGNAELVRELESSARAALGWLEGPGDLDGDGYLEYRRRSNGRGALDNHCWRDSDGSIRFRDGRAARPPIASSEIQAYAYDARLRTARLARDVWGDEQLARRLERDAAELKERFDRDFWSGELGSYVLALDGRKQQVDTLTSNLGHLLWCGIVPEERAERLREQLTSEGLFSGWGVRTITSSASVFNPLGYHLGTVWPHDTAIAAEGLRRYGFRADASRLALALLEAADAFDNRLPELFAGFERDASGVPVEYPGALRPQAWAAGAPLLAIRTLLGLDAVDGEVRHEPHLVEPIERLELRGLVRGFRMNVP